MDNHYGGVIWTNHALARLKERGIKQGDAWATWRNPQESRKGTVNGSWVYYRTYGNVKIEVVAKQNEKKAKVVMATVRVPDFDDWRHCFSNFSRIIRQENGKIKNTVEKKDASEEELKIKEVNPCYFCFDSDWLWSHLDKLKNENAQKEYYLTDLIKMATEEGEEIESIEIDAHEALGANNKEELNILEKFV